MYKEGIRNEITVFFKQFSFFFCQIVVWNENKLYYHELCYPKNEQNVWKLKTTAYKYLMKIVFFICFLFVQESRAELGNIPLVLSSLSLAFQFQIRISYFRVLKVVYWIFIYSHEMEFYISTFTFDAVENVLIFWTRNVNFIQVHVCIFFNIMFYGSAFRIF